MSKGRKPRTNNVYTVEIRESVFADGVGGNDTIVETCWDFPLVDTTDSITSIKQDDSVRGSIVEQKQLVMIRSGGKPIGYAPTNISQEIIKTARELGGQLSGSVTSKRENDTNVSIHLCLN